jgi:hypothetical protein
MGNNLSSASANTNTNTNTNTKTNTNTDTTTSPLSSMDDDLSDIEKKNLLKDHDFSYILNYIATRYILTMDFQSLKNLQDPKYCDEMIILTSDIIKKYYNEREIDFLQQKIEQGQQTNKLTKDKILYFNKNDLSNKGVDNGIKKNRMCIGIAKFYIKIAHIFSAIVMTVNPIYVYKDNNQTIKKSLLEKKDIPSGTEPKIEKMGICNARFELLNIGNNYLNKMNEVNVKNTEYDEDGNTISGNNPDSAENNIRLKKKYCNINKNIATNTSKENLSDEPGIPELMNLYYDKYDYEKGVYNDMTDESRKRLMDDLFLFYKHFTGIEDVIKEKNPELNDKQINEQILQEFNKQGIKKFSDIKLKDYSSTFENICSNKSGGQVDSSIFNVTNKTPDNMLDNATTIENDKSNSNKLDYAKQQDFLKKYAENLKKMLNTINVEQEKLLSVLNELFVYVVHLNKKQIIINPELTNESLDKIVIKTREIIIGLYLQCESDYIDGLKLYQALIESQMFVNEKSKENNLNKERERLFNPAVSRTKPDSKTINIPSVPSQTFSNPSNELPSRQPISSSSQPPSPQPPSSQPPSPQPPSSQPPSPQPPSSQPSSSSQPSPSYQPTSTPIPSPQLTPQSPQSPQSQSTPPQLSSAPGPQPIPTT